LSFKFSCLNASLLALGLRSLGAVIVGVAKKERLGHIPDRHLTSGTGIAVAICKFEPARAAHYLLLLLGGDHAGASTAANEAGEWEMMMLAGPRISCPAEQRLNAIEFFFGNHRLMFALMQMSASTRILKPAVVKGIVKNMIERAHAQRIAALLLGSTGAKSPLLIGELQNPRRRVVAGEHQLPHALDDRKPLRVGNKLSFTRILGFVIEVSHGRHAGIPAQVDFGAQSAFYINTLVVVLKLGLATKKCEEKFVAGSVSKYLARCAYLNQPALVHKINERGCIGRVSGKTIGVPAKNSIGFAPFDSLHQLHEYGARAAEFG